MVEHDAKPFEDSGRAIFYTRNCTTSCDDRGYEMTGRTPLAWLNLKHDLRRLAVAVAGICFAVLLMFMETGFMYALFDSTVKLVDDADADLVLVSPARYVLAAEK